MADTSSPALARLREFSADRVRAEKVFHEAFERERSEAIRLIEEGQAGTVAVAEVMGRTREALRQSRNRWRKERERLRTNAGDSDAACA